MTPRSSAFASDNAAPAHPTAIDAVIAANTGNVPSYGTDPVTAHAAARLRETFESPDAEVLFTFTGTGANIIALAAGIQPWNSILCSDIAHALLDEAGGPVRLSGSTIIPLPSDDGLIEPAALDKAIAVRGDVHHPQPRIVTITQSTENGRVWTSGAIAEFVDHAHELDLLVHVDGSRVANAIGALHSTPLEAVGDADIVTVGGTKNGMLFGDAIVVRRPEHFRGIHFVQKQIGHLASKHRFVSAQFDALLTGGLWLDLGAHANTMAARLSTGLAGLGLELAAPTEANEVFVILKPDIHAVVSNRYAVHAPEPLRPIYRFVCSWSTTEDEVDGVVDLLRGL